MRLRNVCPLGDIEVLGRVVEAGAVFEVSDEQAARLLEQSANYEPVKAEEAKQ